MNERILAFVSCTKRKKLARCSAKELYSASAFFRMAMGMAEKIAGEVLILSAKHGVVRPDDSIDPYNKTLLNMSRVRRRKWAKDVHGSLLRRPTYRKAQTIIWFAGMVYREDLLELVSQDGKKSFVPLEGKSWGKQLAWLKRLQALPADELKRKIMGIRY